MFLFSHSQWLKCRFRLSKNILFSESGNSRDPVCCVRFLSLLSACFSDILIYFGEFFIWLASCCTVFVTGRFFICASVWFYFFISTVSGNIFCFFPLLICLHHYHNAIIWFWACVFLFFACLLFVIKKGFGNQLNWNSGFPVSKFDWWLYFITSENLIILKIS